MPFRRASTSKKDEKKESDVSKYSDVFKAAQNFSACFKDREGTYHDECVEKGKKEMIKAVSQTECKQEESLGFDEYGEKFRECTRKLSTERKPVSSLYAFVWLMITKDLNSPRT